MAKVSLAEHMQERPAGSDGDQENIGPFITISRQFGCWGFSLGLLLLDICNDQARPGEAWRIYHKEILDRLASETNLDTETLDKQRRSKPGLLGELLRSFSKDRLPSGIEVRNRMTSIIRTLATEGRCILVGQGSAGATADMPNGLSIRLEAPEEWRVKQVAFREGLGETEAKLMVQQKQREREYLQKIYAQRYPRKPPFSLVYDCSVFTLAQIAQHVIYAMKLKGMID
jgi:hypothetical protein